MSERAEVVVVGMGPGGEHVAGTLAESGMDVIGIDGRLAGGECPYWGCVPSKMMLRAAALLAESRRAREMAGEVSVRPDWSLVARRIRDEATDDSVPSLGLLRSPVCPRPVTGPTGKPSRPRMCRARSRSSVAVRSAPSSRRCSRVSGAGCR